MAVAAHRTEGVIVIKVQPPRRKIEVDSEDFRGNHAADPDHLRGKKQEAKARPLGRIKDIRIDALECVRKQNQRSAVNEAIRD